MNYGRLMNELKRHEIELVFADLDGEEHVALFVDGARAGEWTRVPRMDCDACKRRKRKAS